MNINKPKVTYAPIHSVKSREVTAADLPRVIEDAVKMHQMCLSSHGVHEGAYAIAHSQLTDNDPLCFFVDFVGRIIINPKITNHTKVTVPREEGCMSFPEFYKVEVQRWNKVEVEYKSFPRHLKESELSWDELETYKDNVGGVDAQVFQHEIDHMNAKYIFMHAPPKKYEEAKAPDTV